MTGTSFTAWMAENVLAPLGMRHSRFDSSHAGLATAYDEDGAPVASPRFTETAAAGLETTVDDIAQFAAAGLETTGAPAGRGVVTPDTVRRMHDPVAPADTYGLGHQIERRGRHVVVGHGGANTGWSAAFWIAPAEKSGFVVLTNSTAGTHVTRFLTCRWRRSIGAIAADEVCPRAIGPIVLATVRREGARAAVAAYRAMRADRPGEYLLEERQLNEAGYRLLRGGDIDAAIAIFQLNTEEYPRSGNVHDSLGEAWLTRGDRANAIESYRRSLELDPTNQNAVDVLKRLGVTP